MDWIIIYDMDFPEFQGRIFGVINFWVFSERDYFFVPSQSANDIFTTKMEKNVTKIYFIKVYRISRIHIFSVKMDHYF